MRNSFPYVIATLMAGCGAPVAAADKPLIAPPPAWVKPVPLPADPVVADGTAIRVLLVDQQMRFGPDGDSLYSETAARVQTPQGLAPMGNFAVRWKPETDVITFHKFQILRGKEVIDVLAKEPGFTILRREQNLEYAALDGVLTATIQPEGLQVGDIVDIAYTMRRSDPLLKGHSGQVVSSRSSAQVGKLTISALWPKDKAMRVRSIAPPVTPAIDTAAGRFALSAARVDPLIGPKGAPLRFWTDGQIEFSDFTSWADVAATFAPLYDAARKLKPDSPLNTEISRIRAASADPVKRAEAALALVQDKVRYIFLGLNDGHLRPADADTSWQRRFGDCKAKTVLLLAILDALGIRAEPALVNTVAGDGLDERLPAAQLFDHVIARATIGDKVYWLDGTRMGDRSLARLRIPPFHWALPLRNTGAALEPLVVPPLTEPDDITDVHIDASAGIGQPAKAHIETIFAGDEAISTRFRLADMQPADLDRLLREYWKGRYDFITPTAVSARFDEATATEHLVMEGLAKLDWNLNNPPPYYEVDGASIGWRPDFIREPGPHHDAPFAMGYPSYAVHRETLTLPDGGKGFWVEGKDVDQTLAGYHFRRKTALAGNVLTMEASTRSLVPEISAAEAVRSTEALRELSKRSAYVRAPKTLVAAQPIPPVDLPDIERIKPVDTARSRQISAEQYLAARDDVHALAEASAAIRLDQALVAAYQLRAGIFRNRGQYKESGAEADALIKADPANSWALATAAFILCNAERRADGLVAFGKSLSLSADEGTYLARARCRPLEDASGRRADIEAALRLRPTSPAALTMLARLQRDQGDHAGEIASLQTLTAADPRNESARIQLGGALARARQVARARSLFAAVRAEAKTNAMSLNALCWEAATAGFELDQAYADCKAALAIRPESAAIQDSLGLTLLRLKRYGEAIAAYDAALKIAPRQASALYGRGLARAASNSPDAGDADMKMARSLRPEIDATFRSYAIGTKGR